jgi:hypothetical protein
MLVRRMGRGGQQYDSYFRHYDKSWKTAGEGWFNSDKIAEFFNWYNLSSRAMALGSTMSLTEMGTRSHKIAWTY